MANERQSVTVSLNGKLWVEFKKYCIDKEVHASNLFEKFMAKELNVSFSPKKSMSQQGVVSGSKKKKGKHGN